jgi:site-specific DNA-methyltransferase (adenine-specific)
MTSTVDLLSGLEASLATRSASIAVRDPTRQSYLVAGDALATMDALIEAFPGGCFDMIFADPPYLLSNGGITCQSGEMVSVEKGEWDRSQGIDADFAFTTEWLARCQRLLKRDGTIWVSGTRHVIHTVGFAMMKLGFKLLNDIVWEKPNPPPNLSCRYFVHSTETILWAAKGPKSKHVFNYEDMREENGGKQMKSAVWRFLPPGKGEKTFGRHPTQKPIALLERCILASTRLGDIVMDPFSGSSTTGVAALKHGRGFFGIEADEAFVELSRRRMAIVQEEMPLS